MTKTKQKSEIYSSRIYVINRNFVFAFMVNMCAYSSKLNVILEIHTIMNEREKKRKEKNSASLRFVFFRVRESSLLYQIISIK